jgi:hypothetical protein
VQEPDKRFQAVLIENGNQCGFNFFLHIEGIGSIQQESPLLGGGMEPQR